MDKDIAHKDITHKDIVDLMDEDLFEAARAIRPYLPRILGDEAGAFDRKLVPLLARLSEGEDVGEQLVDLLSRDEAVLNWVALVLADGAHRPPEFQPMREKATEYQDAVGNPSVVDAVQYVCPVDGLFTEYRAGPGDPVGCCPDHPGVSLEPV
ncbi:hypothetical protein [Streptomyces sp. I05A-00742]|uniref:hypothetical protein n=1 Tax=Streptomyces sp. I05A-00742 TaxID=2732853 RepID=UPI0014883E33|nr:hypothetical protein [Streptomyces sp. I05A-00742]